MTDVYFECLVHTPDQALRNFWRKELKNTPFAFGAHAQAIKDPEWLKCFNDLLEGTNDLAINQLVF